MNLKCYWSLNLSGNEDFKRQTAAGVHAGYVTKEYKSDDTWKSGGRSSLCGNDAVVVVFAGSPTPGSSYCVIPYCVECLVADMAVYGHCFAAVRLQGFADNDDDMWKTLTRDKARPEWWPSINEISIVIAGLKSLGVLQG